MIASYGVRGKSTFGALRRSLFGANETSAHVLYDQDHRSGKIRKRDVMDLSVGADVASIPYWWDGVAPQDWWYYRGVFGVAGDDVSLWLLQRASHWDARTFYLVELSLSQGRILRELSDVLPPVRRPKDYIMGGDSDVLYVVARPAGVIARIEPSTMSLSAFVGIAGVPLAAVNNVAGDGDTIWLSIGSGEHGIWIYRINAQTLTVLDRVRPPEYEPDVWTTGVAAIGGGSNHLFLYELRQQQIMEPPFTGRRWMFTLYRYDVETMTVVKQLRTTWTTAAGELPGDEFVLGLIAN